MLKKQQGFSKVVIFIIVLAVIAGGVLTWQFWPESVVEQEPIVEQEPPTEEPLIINEIDALFGELQETTQLEFLIDDVEFYKDPSLEGEKITGKGFQIEDNNGQNYQLINTFFAEHNFNVIGGGDATLKGFMVYQNKSTEIICLISGDSTTGTVVVKCGK